MRFVWPIFTATRPRRGLIAASGTLAVRSQLFTNGYLWSASLSRLHASTHKV
jgi:hypothetical protein